MKNLVLMMLMSVLAVGVQAQNDAIAKYFSKYVNHDKFSHVVISGKMFSMINQIKIEDDDESKAIIEALGKIKGVKVLFSKEEVPGKTMYKKALGLIEGKGYEELMSVREDEKDIKFMIKEKNNKIHELFMIIGADQDFGLLSIIGDGIDLNALYKLSKKMGMKGFEELELLEELEQRKKKN